MNSCILDIRDLEISFFTQAGEIKAVNNISLQLKDGEVLGIVGESGSGKSVASYSIMGLIAEPGKIVNGNIRFNNHTIETMGKKELQKIRGKEVSIVFQDPNTSLNPLLSIGSQLIEVIIRHTNKTKKEAKERAVELLGLVGMNEVDKRLKQYPYEFSGGMLQRVMIAIALACEPKLLIADEATTALDATIQAQILELLLQIKKKNSMSIIMITHDFSVIANICEKVAVMYAGRIIEYGKTEDILYNPKHQYTMGLLKATPNINSHIHEKLVPIKGSPVDLLNPPLGCPFAPRCEKCMKICLRSMPKNKVISDDHYTACWLLEKKLWS
ncbi:ATP-binding cassette domain-containing protein [Alkalibaculum sp. M08DMB]|uniref:ATP-binding cassette domain-containing protein n=1 Tax=Alkalibaculum sporogenes TaxID=2655001 RepID=A0A6A7K672_9FIRM|nr:ATP-binding cassette domain-containing protein [Alkalibaculum sporogenes]